MILPGVKKEVFVALGLRRDLNETKQRFKFKMRKNAVMRKLIIIFLLALSGLTASELCFAAIYSGGNGSGWSYAQATPVMYRGGSGKGESTGAMLTDTPVGYSSATQVVFSTQPTNSVRNAYLATSPVAQIQDVYGNIVMSATNVVAIGFVNNPTGATLGGTISKSASSGQATFSDLTINKYGTVYTLSASAQDLTSDTSNAFNISYGTAAQLGFSTQPSSGAYAGVAFTTQPVVQIFDAVNNLVENATNNIALSIGTDPPGSSTLGGTTSMNAVAGIADFSGKGLKINRAGTGFTLSATSLPLAPATSNAFNILSPVQIVTPNGGEIWTISTANSIFWSSNGPLATGDNTLQYSLDNGSSWVSPPIATKVTVSPASWVTPSTASTQVKVRISNSADSTFSDTSDAVFSLLAGFTIISPNGGEVWASGFDHTISWQTSGTVANVKLEYSSDGGSNWNTITGSTANAGSYNWNPSVASGGANYIVRVSDAANSNAKAQSATAFTIQKIAVTAPTSGQRIQADSSAPTNVTWLSGGINNIKLEYSLNGGAWTQIAGAESLAAALGSYYWPVPDNFVTSINVKLRLSSTAADSDSNTIYAITNAFTIYGQLTLTAPTEAGISWSSNSPHDITWATNKGVINNVKLEYSADNFSADIHTIVDSVANTIGTYSWTPVTTGVNFKVRVSDAQDSQTNSVSNNYFSVTGIGIASPASGATWNCGSVQTISWTSSGSSFSNAKIEYFDGSAWHTITSSTPNIGSFSWTVANTPTNAALIRVSNVSDPTLVGTSQVFNIKSVLTVTAPNGGETLNVGSSSNISWTASGTVAKVKLEYYNGSSWNTIIDSTSNTGTYSWTVPDTITSSALVRVTDIDAGHPDSSGQSAGSFTIQSNIALTAPASGVNWAVNETHNITWTNTGTVGQVRLWYATSKDSYATWTEITSGATTNVNTYSWVVPDIILSVGNNPQTTPTLAVKLKVTDAISGHPATAAISNIFNVIYYAVTFSVKDFQTQSDMANLSVACSSGWSATGLTSGVNTSHNYPYGIYTTIWSRADYTDSSYANWTADSAKTLSLTMTLSAVAGQEYHVYSNFTYDATSDSFLINSWLEKSGSIVTNPTSCDVTVYDKNGNIIDINGSGTAGTDLISIVPNTNGVFRQNWDLVNINRNTSYFGKVQIAYQGTIYSSNVTYSISVPSVSTVSQVTALSQSVSDIQSSISNANAGLTSKVNTLQQDVTSVKNAVGTDQGTTLYSKVSDILTNTGTNIPDTIASELKKGPRSKILNRPTQVNVGDKVSIRYATDSGKTPTITVYDANNITRISGAVMAENGSTGVYNYDVTFDPSWGTGDYTVICSEPVTNSADSMIINVGTGTGISGIEAKVNALSATLNTVSTNIANINTIMGTTTDSATTNTLFGKVNGVSANASNLASQWGSYNMSDINSYIKSLQEYMGGPNDSCGMLTVFGKVACVSGQTGDITTTLNWANKAYTEIEQLRTEVNFNGKSSTAYDLVNNINTTVGQVKDAIVKANSEGSEGKVKEVAESVRATKEALKKLASDSGLKGTIKEKEQARLGPATLEGLQNQLIELKKSIETVKATLQGKQEPVVKTWFEKGEKK